MATLVNTRLDVRAHLAEITPRMWTDAQLNVWINEGLRDIARRTETIQSLSTAVPVIAGTATVTVPADALRLHRIEFVPTGAGQVYQVKLVTLDELEQVFGITPNTQQGYPVYAAAWGFPPAVTLRLYPVPSQAGTLNIYYYRLPAVVAADGDVLEVLAGYEDLIVLYAEYVARRKDRDPSWQDAKALYEERVTYMVETTRQWHDQAMSVTIGSHAVPAWLYEFGD